MSDKYGLYGVGLAQPAVKDDVYDEYLTRADNERQILQFYRTKRKIPLCLDHGDGDRPGYIVPERDRIGYVLDLFIGRQNALMAKFKLSNKHEAYNRIHDGITERHEPWGLSVWIERLEDRTTGRVVKKLTHIALTLDPFFADYNSYMYRYSLNENLINNAILGDLYWPGAGCCYGTREFKKKLLGMWSRCARGALRHRSPKLKMLTIFDSLLLMRHSPVVRSTHC